MRATRALSAYREHPPPPALAPWLACTWERRDGGGDPVRAVPDGCIDLIWTEGRGARVVGANTTAFLVALGAGTSVVGARMRPGAGPALLGVDGAAVRDGHLELADVWADDGRRLEQRLDAADDDERLARELAISPRQLRRRCESAVGYARSGCCAPCACSTRWVPRVRSGRLRRRHRHVRRARHRRDQVRVRRPHARRAELPRGRAARGGRRRTAQRRDRARRRRRGRRLRPRARGGLQLARRAEGQPQGQRVAWVRDPFGTLLELATPL